jgi:nicotinamide phosphoribosyltransferase
VIPAARYFYDEPEDEVCINSVNASEHSVSTTKIFTVGESQMIADWLDIFQAGILSIVSDTFDLWKLITVYLPEHKEAIMNRDGKLVIRPDSGDPVDIICGTVQHFYSDLREAENEFYDDLHNSQPHGERQLTISETRVVKIGNKYYELEPEIEWGRYDKQYYYIDTCNISSREIELKPEHKGVIELLWDIFGGTINEQGYKLLDSHIGAIYGDSITLERQIEIYKRLAAKGFASTNIVLGVGSFTYQFNTRDTLGFAAKGAWFESDTETYDIYKDPITDDGTKKSLKGLIMVDENYEVHTQCTPEQEAAGILRTIYEDGKFYNQTSLTEIREKLKNSI